MAAPRSGPGSRRSTPRTGFQADAIVGAAPVEEPSGSQRIDCAFAPVGAQARSGCPPGTPSVDQRASPVRWGADAFDPRGQPAGRLCNPDEERNPWRLSADQELKRSEAKGSEHVGRGRQHASTLDSHGAFTLMNAVRPVGLLRPGRRRRDSAGQPGRKAKGSINVVIHGGIARCVY